MSLENDQEEGEGETSEPQQAESEDLLNPQEEGSNAGEEETLDDFQLFEREAGIESGLASQSRWERRHGKKAKKKKIITICIISFVFAAVIVGGGIATSRFSGGLFSWFGNAVESDYPGPGYGSVNFTINPGEGTSQVAQGLVKAGIVASENGFVSAVESNNDGQDLQPGTFALKYKMSSNEVLAIIT
ncbi:MAG: endolytic transglycosylase MltG, partial [Aeriscardovia sp.]|nr:endolytic transglycosylase MltG [Aeriscardovia sp.]